jgi:hypothetical protein
MEPVGRLRSLVVEEKMWIVHVPAGKEEAVGVLLKALGLQGEELPEIVADAVAVMTQNPQALRRKPSTSSSSRMKSVASESGARPLAPGHVRHSWSAAGEAGIDECIKCGTRRHMLDRGDIKFVLRDGEEVLRRPFQGQTPSCDEGLLKSRHQ